MTGLLAILLARFRAALRRRLIAYLLMAAAALLGLFGAGYGLDAAHAALSHAHGPVVASLIIAGGLLIGAAACAALALATQALVRPAQLSPRIADPAAYAAPNAAIAARKQRSLAALAAGALSAGAAAALYARRRWRRPLPDRHWSWRNMLP
jgi:hypothetical protein